MEANPFFPSTIDHWKVRALAGSAIACLVARRLLLAAAPRGGLMLIALMLLAGAVLLAWVLLGTGYRFERRTPVVRGGPLRWRIPAREIYAVRPTHCALSSPALSLDRLRLEYGEDRVIQISPRDVAAFMQELQARGGPPLASA
jgi:hypothetical protein